MFFEGPWDVVVAPATEYFASQALRKHPGVLVYGPPHLFRAAWLAGAQDYLREPWSVDELYLRSQGSRAAVHWRWGGEDLCLDGSTLSTTAGTWPLTSTEAGLLRVLAQRQGTPVSRGVLAWAAACTEGRVVDTLIARLRTKLRRAVGRDDNPIAAVRGVGYRLP